ncbi:hypothetical protein D3C86_1312150 [compost metagenome]
MRRSAQFTGQPETAGAEHRRQRTDFTVRRQRDLHAAIKRIAIERPATLLGASENAVLTEHSEDFAGHESVEVHDAAVGHFHPFRMAARQADQQISARLARQVLQHAEHLGLFAAHHVRQRRTLDDAGHDVHIDAAQAAHGLQGSTERGDVRRRVAVGRFAPALGTADHAAGNHRQIRLGIEPVAASLIEGQLETIGTFPAANDSQRVRQLHDPRGQRTLFEHLAAFSQFVST